MIMSALILILLYFCISGTTFLKFSVMFKVCWTTVHTALLKTFLGACMVRVTGLGLSQLYKSRRQFALIFNCKEGESNFNDHYNIEGLTKMSYDWPIIFLSSKQLKCQYCSFHIDVFLSQLADSSLTNWNWNCYIYLLLIKR